MVTAGLVNVICACVWFCALISCCVFPVRVLLADSLCYSPYLSSCGANGFFEVDDRFHPFSPPPTHPTLSLSSFPIPYHTNTHITSTADKAFTSYHQQTRLCVESIVIPIQTLHTLIYTLFLCHSTFNTCLLCGGFSFSRGNVRYIYSNTGIHHHPSPTHTHH